MKRLFDEWAKATLGKMAWQGRRISVESVNADKTITAAGTTGNQTINATTGTVNFAAGATAITVTNSYCSTGSIILHNVRTNDTTANVKNIVPGPGSFVITLTAAATAETSVGFFIVN